MRKPGWARDAPPPGEAVGTLELAETAGERMRADVAADRLHTRGVGSLPVDLDRARVEISEEQRAQRLSRPRKRRWKALDKLDAEVDRLLDKQQQAAARVAGSEAALARAPADDAASLAAWLANGEKGAPPPASVYERQRDADAAKLLADAVGVELDRALERRVQHVETNRRKMLDDARAEIDETRRRLLAKLAELAPLRDELIAARELLCWAAAFPQPVESFGFPTAVALGLAEPLRRTLGTTARLDYAALLALLEEDAATLAQAFSATQKAQLGEPVKRTPLREALWDSDPDNVAWKKEELERARRLAEYGNHDRIAAEARDLRPDP